MSIPIEKLGKRAVLVIGKSGSGKSSLCRALTDDSQFEINHSFQSGTKEPTLKTISVRGKDISNTPSYDSFSIDVIDCPGLFDTEEEIGSTLEKIAKKIDLEVVKLTSIFICLNKDKITDREFESVSSVFDKFGKIIGKITTIIITHCENETTNTKEKLKQDINNSKLKDLIQLVKGVELVGFPYQEDYDEDQLALKSYHKSIRLKYRQLLFEVICNSSTEIYRKDFLVSPEIQDMNNKLELNMREKEDLEQQMKKLNLDLQQMKQNRDIQLQQMKQNRDIQMKQNRDIQLQIGVGIVGVLGYLFSKRF